MIRHHFDSLQDFCNCAVQVPANKALVTKYMQDEHGNWRDYCSTSGNRDATPQRVLQWLGAPDTKTAGDRVVKGWAEGASKVFNNMATMEVPVPHNIKRKVSRADQGDELDIHKVYSGDLDHAWTRRTRKHTRARKQVRIVAQTNLLADMDFDELFWRGAAVLKLCDLLTEAGYSVEIVGAMASRRLCGVDEDILATFVMKPANTPVDAEMLAGVLCNAGFHRLYGFRAYACLADFAVTNPHRHPAESATDTTGKVLEKGNLGGDGTHTVYTQYGITSKQSAEQWVTEQIATLDKQD